MSEESKQSKRTFIKIKFILKIKKNRISENNNPKIL